jgi:glycosyltransferase involved in cell wall biosynthesis
MAHDDPHGKVVPDDMKLMTGTTTALVKQAEWAAKNGHEVYWVGNTKDHTWQGVRFCERLRYAAEVFGPFDITICSSMQVVIDWPTKVFVVDCQVGIPRWNLKLPHIDAVQCHSGWQAEQLAAQGLIEAHYIIPNGQDPAIFYPATEREPRSKAIFLHTSSPDRGLHHVFPILDRLSDLCFEFHVFYNVHGWMRSCWWAHDEMALRARAIFEGMKKPYVVYHGPTRQDELANWYRQADLLIYPCDPVVPTETFCTTILESMACGCVPLISEADCLPSLYGDVAPLMPLPIEYDAWAHAIRSLLDPKTAQPFMQKGLTFATSYTWDKIAPLWEENYVRLLEEKAHGKDPTGTTA